MKSNPKKFANERSLLNPMHRIIQRNAIQQNLFFYVQGVHAVNPEVPISVAVQSYCDRFLPEYNNTLSMQQIYTRQLRDYLNESQIYK